MAPAWKYWGDKLMRGRRGLHLLLGETAGVQRASRVLDLATGIGEPALTLAEEFQPAEIIGADFSAAMLAVAADRFAQNEGTRFRALHMDAPSLPLAARSFDAVVSCFGFEYFPDLDLISGECARLLKPGGKIAIGIWGNAQENPFHTVLTDPLAQVLGSAEPPALFRFQDPALLLGPLARAGFVGLSSRKWQGSYVFSDFSELWRLKVEGSPPLAKALADLSPAALNQLQGKVREACRHFEREGQITLPFTTLVIGGQIN